MSNKKLQELATKILVENGCTKHGRDITEQKEAGYPSPMTVPDVILPAGRRLPKVAYFYE